MKPWTRLRGWGLRGWLAVPLGLLGGAAANGPAPATSPVTAAATLASFKGLVGLEARFHEEKRLKLLAAPLISDGSIYFLAPDHLTRQVISPSKSRTTIDGTTLAFEDEQGRHSLPLNQNPVARIFVDSFDEILTGNVTALEHTYTVTVRTGPRGAWSLQLEPLTKPLTGLIQRIEVYGRGRIIDRMLIREVGGDETLTTFSSVDTDRRFTAEERSQIFPASQP